jgi:hypothetical protein
LKTEGALVFGVAFLAVMFVTVGWLELPPGRELAKLLGITIADSSSSGVPIAGLQVGLLNGVIYGITALLVFTLVTIGPAAVGRERSG